MQPTPLTGTATNAALAYQKLVARRCSPHPSRGRQPDKAITGNHLSSDAAHTPHGDGNYPRIPGIIIARMKDAAHTPHGDGNLRNYDNNRVDVKDAAHTPHGDGNPSAKNWFTNSYFLGCSPHPSRGRQL